ncbi:MAG: LmeA family phospholipid-binding protein [Rubrobacter sp.]
MRSVLAAVLLPVVALLLIGPYTFLPPVIEYAVARDVQSRLGLDEAPEVDLKSDPPLRMVAGEVSGGTIRLEDAGLGGVRTETATIDLDPFDVNVIESIGRGSMVAGEPLSGGLRVEVPEAEVARLIGDGADVPVRDVDVTASGMEVQSEATVFGTTLPVSAPGTLTLSGQNFVFEPRNLTAAGVSVPQELADAVLAGTEFDYPIKGLPYGSRITSVEPTDGLLVLTGRVPRIPLGVYPGG